MLNVNFMLMRCIMSSGWMITVRLWNKLMKSSFWWGTFAI
jgi:hypothetical protein